MRNDADAIFWSVSGSLGTKEQRLGREDHWSRRSGTDRPHA